MKWKSPLYGRLLTSNVVIGYPRRLPCLDHFEAGIRVSLRLSISVW